MKILGFATTFAIAAIVTSPAAPRVNGTYAATAYSVTGITASGVWTNRHVIAADPDLLPLGSRVSVKRAGKYSGEYVVADTGVKIQGRKIDIYMPSEHECRIFGVKPVRIKVLSVGAGTKEDVKQAAQTVKTDVAKDVAKGKVGNAATEVDWAKKGKPVEEAVKANANATPTPAATTNQ